MPYLEPNVEFWTRLPSYADIGPIEFLNPDWQDRNSIKNLDQLAEILSSDDVNPVIKHLKAYRDISPMAMRLTPYLCSLINWSDPFNDPIRRQFLPMTTELIPDLNVSQLDSLNELSTTPIPGLVRRYPDKVLLLTSSHCPIYCTFCTRSYTVGPSTPRVKKMIWPYKAQRMQILDWLKQNPEIEDVTVSGGDPYTLRPQDLSDLIDSLADIKNIRRIRIGTRGLLANPSKFFIGSEWIDSLLRSIRRARKKLVSVSIHVHFNHSNEITWITRLAANRLFQEGVTLRNQTVLLRGINDNKETMLELVKNLGRLQIQPYYVYMMDIVPGVEHLRTTLKSSIEIDKWIRGRTSGFNTPTFVVDLPGGGGKRSIHSYESYDIESGIAIFQSQVMGIDRIFRYTDPVLSSSSYFRSDDER